MTKIIVLNCIIVALAVGVHFEALGQLSTLLPKLTRIPPRWRIVIGVLGAICAHTIEVWLFALAFYWMIHGSKLGALGGNTDNSLLDCAYFSLTSYTSLGFGDIEPTGQIRFLAGFEALTGLILITWTASFLFLIMQREWKLD